MPQTGSGRERQGGTEARAIAYDFLRALQSEGVTADKAFLFGSHSRGEADENSDIDVIVVSRDFSRMPAWRRWEVMGKAVARLMESIEPLGYSPEELEAAMGRKGSFIRHVLSQPETVELEFQP